VNALTAPASLREAARVPPPLHPDVAAWLAGRLLPSEEAAAEEAFTEILEDDR